MKNSPGRRPAGSKKVGKPPVQRVNPVVPAPVSIPFWARVLLVGILAVVPYLGTLRYPYSYMDDNIVILLQEKMLKDADVVRAFQSEFFNQEDEPDYFYRPLQTLTFIGDYQLAGLDIFQYRLTGILLHALVAITLMVFLGQLGVSAWVAFGLSLLFSVHPAFAPVQLFIAARADSLVALFLMLSMIGLIRYAVQPGIGWLALHVVGFALALFTKETGVFLPVVSTVYILLYPSLAGKRRSLLLRLVPFWIGLAVFWFFMRKAALSNPPDIEMSLMLSQFFENLPGIFLYVGVLFAPFSLPSILVLRSPYLWVGIAVSLVILYFLTRRTRPVPRWVIWLGASWFGLFVLVTFLSPSNLPLFDYLLNRTYVPAIGLSLLLGYLLDRFVIPPRRIAVFTALCLPVLIYLNYKYTHQYSDRIRTWDTLARQAPNSAHVLKHQIFAYEQAGRQGEISELYIKAVQLSPKTLNVNYSAGVVLYQRGQKEQAFALFMKEYALNPKHAQNLNYIGVYYESKQMLARAKEYYLRSAEQDSTCQHCLWNSVRACAMTADRAQGKKYLQLMKSQGYPVPIKAVEDYILAR
ncbi:MAG: phospholipid carrier-dependent glycosyltransferase [Bacteroidetes bacterium]|nr:phospholipid carrier-dependent glycosyltransferase [Bacteroidota bacterium]